MSELREGRPSLTKKVIKGAGKIAAIGVVVVGGLATCQSLQKPIGHAVSNAGEAAHSAAKNAADALFELDNNNDMRGKLMPDKLPPKEVQDEFVEKYKETMNPPVPTLGRPKR